MSDQLIAVPDVDLDELRRRINAGSGSGWNDIAGEHFTGDTGSSGGATQTTTSAIAGTADDALYQSTRNGQFCYNLAVPSGRYRVTLLLSDNTSTAAGQRVFDVAAEGSTRLSGVDPYALAGGGKAATSKSFDLAVTDGTLSLETIAVTGSPTIAGIRVQPLPPTGQQHVSQVTGGVPTGHTVDSGVLPGTIFAQDHNEGGQGAGYQIASPQATTSTYRPDATNLIDTTDTTYGGGQGVGGLSTGDRLNYTVNVVAGGNYDLRARLSSNVATGKFQVLVDEVSVNVPNAGGVWTSVPLRRDGRRSRTWANENHGLQEGDAAKAAAAILTLADLDQMPAYLPLGSSTLDDIRTKLEDVAAELETWQYVARSTDHTSA